MASHRHGKEGVLALTAAGPCNRTVAALSTPTPTRQGTSSLEDAWTGRSLRGISRRGRRVLSTVATPGWSQEWSSQMVGSTLTLSESLTLTP